MIRLVRVELTRLRWRRAVLLLLLACFVAPLLILGGTAWETRPVSDADRARAEQQAAAEAAQPYIAEEVERCERRPERYGGPDMTADQCDEMIVPQPDQFLYRSQLDLGEMTGGQGVGVVVILSALLLILGTTFAGHDWNTGSMSNQLLFDPRRGRLWLAKAAAVLIAGLLVATAVLLLFWGGAALLAAQRDIDTSARTWELVRSSVLRGIVLVALAGVLGYALTMLFRSTVATLGVGFAAAMGGSLLLVGVFGERALGWLPTSNYLAVLQDGYRYYVYTPECEAFQMEQMDQGVPMGPEGFVDPCMAEISMSQGVLYWSVLLTVVVALSVLSFRRRDVP